MKRISIFIAALALLASCQRPVPQAFSVIPYPNEVNLTEGTYNVKGTAIAVDPAMDEASKAAVHAVVDGDVADAFSREDHLREQKRVPATRELFLGG